MEGRKEEKKRERDSLPIVATNEKEESLVVGLIFLGRSCM